MRFFALLPLLAAASATLGVAPTDTDGTVNEESYPLCPANYDTYCCFTVVPYSNHCRRGRCKQEYGWSCLSGPGKVDSIRTCLTREDQEAPKMSAYCKRPGYQYFPSVLAWEGDIFKPMLEPADYGHWVKPHMHKPWTPSSSDIQWDSQGEHVGEKNSHTDSEELRKRSLEQDSDLE